MRVALLFLSLLVSWSEAHADDCASVRRTRVLAASQGIDTTNLRALERRLCLGGGRRVARFTSECSALFVMEELALTASDDAQLIATVSAARATACAAPDEPPIIDWPGGGRAQSAGGGWRYPNGQTARSVTGAWYYPTGHIARSVSGAWTYPDGSAALATNRWRAPGGETFQTPGELTTWACSVGGSSCREVIAELPDLPEDVQEAAMVRIAWHAQVALEGT